MEDINALPNHASIAPPQEAELQLLEEMSEDCCYGLTTLQQALGLKC